jgi:hypothetical protein
MGNVIGKTRYELNEIFSLFHSYVAGSIIVSFGIFLFSAIIIVNLDCSIGFGIFTGFFFSAIICFVAFYKLAEKEIFFIRMASFSMVCSILSPVGIIFTQPGELDLSSFFVVVLDVVIALLSWLAIYEADITIERWKIVGINIIFFIATGFLFSFGYYYFFY